MAHGNIVCSAQPSDVLRRITDDYRSLLSNAGLIGDVMRVGHGWRHRFTRWQVFGDTVRVEGRTGRVPSYV